MKRVLAGLSSAYFTAFAAGAALAAPNLNEVEALVVRSTNAFRNEQGRGKLVIDPALTQAARAFAEYMARTDQYGHSADGRDPGDRAKSRGYEYCLISENISHQYSTASFATVELAARLFEGWKESPGHRANMLQPAATDIGVAVAMSPQSGRFYAVEMFGRPRSRMLEFRVTNEARRPVEYRVAGKSWSLATGAARVHTTCGQEELSFPDADSGKETSLRPAGGENFVATGETRITIRHR